MNDILASANAKIEVASETRFCAKVNRNLPLLESLGEALKQCPYRGVGTDRVLPQLLHDWLSQQPAWKAIVSRGVNKPTQRVAMSLVERCIKGL